MMNIRSHKVHTQAENEEFVMETFELYVAHFEDVNRDDYFNEGIFNKVKFFKDYAARVNYSAAIFQARGARPNEGKRMRDLIDRFFLQRGEERVAAQVQDGFSAHAAIEKAALECMEVVDKAKIEHELPAWEKAAMLARGGCYCKQSNKLGKTPFRNVHETAVFQQNQAQMNKQLAL